MSEITLFGRCEMNAKTFAAMPSHMQTEALRLMVDSGYGVGAIEKLTGGHRADLLAAYGAHHRIKPKDEAREVPSREPRTSPYSATARLILLQMQDQAGALAASVSSIAYDLGKGPSSVREALKYIEARGLIEMTAPSRGKGFPAQYRLTSAGEEAAATLAHPTEGAADA